MSVNGLEGLANRSVSNSNDFVNFNSNDKQQNKKICMKQIIQLRNM